MKKQLKRFYSFLLAAAMLFAMLPAAGAVVQASAQAAQDAEEGAVLTLAEPESQPVRSSSSGWNPEPAVKLKLAAERLVAPAVKNWSDPAVEWAEGRNLFGDSMCTPDADVTRGVFVGALGRLANVPMSVKWTRFQDVRQSSWFAPCVNWATDEGIISGVARLRFEPDGVITREQAAAVVYRYLELNGIAPEAKAKTFTDSGEISEFAAEAVQALQSSGILSSRSDGSFAPKDALSYSELAAMLQNLEPKLVK